MEEVMQGLRFWSENFLNERNLASMPCAELCVFSDDSDTGWMVPGSRHCGRLSGLLLPSGRHSSFEKLQAVRAVFASRYVVQPLSVSRQKASDSIFHTSVFALLQIPLRRHQNGFGLSAEGLFPICLWFPIITRGRCGKRSNFLWIRVVFRWSLFLIYRISIWTVCSPFLSYGTCAKFCALLAKEWNFKLVDLFRRWNNLPLCIPEDRVYACFEFNFLLFCVLALQPPVVNLTSVT